MPYLGNKPVNNFVSFAKQDITGNGGTSYSLDYPVTGANDIDLYINNVRQEPTEAYSCSGSTLTLTEAVQSTDDIYAIFRGRALQTAQHPSDSALEASSANISGDTTLGGNLTVNMDQDSTLLVKDGGTNAVFITANTGQELYFGANNEYAFRIKNDGTKDVAFDNGGRVTMPSQPAFTAYQYDTGTADEYPITSNEGTLVANSTAINRGSIYNDNNGRFTAPVAGVYHITFNLSLYCSGIDVDNSVGWGLYVNGSRYLWTTYSSALAVTQSTPWIIGDGNTSDQDNNLDSSTEIGAPHYSANISLSQNDYVQVGWKNLSQALGVRSFIFSGHLIG